VCVLWLVAGCCITYVHLYYNTKLETPKRIHLPYNITFCVMDIVQSVQTYVKRMFSPDNAGGAGGSSGKMKVLLLDNETVRLPNRPYFAAKLFVYRYL